MFNLLWRDIRTSIINGTITVEDLYWLFYSRVWMATGIIFTLSLGVDYYGINGLQLVFLPIWLFVIGYIGLPIIGLSEVTVVTDRLREVVCNLRRFVLHLALFGSIFFVTRFLVPVREYPFASMMLLAGMIIIGLVAWLWPANDPKVYRRYALAIAIIVIALGLFGAFTGQRPANGANPMSPMRDGVKGIVHGFFDKKIVRVQVSSLSEEVEISGLEPGTRKFSVPGEQFVLLLGTNTSAKVNDKIRVNGAKAGESFEVEANGKVKFKVVGPPEFLNQPIDWQELTLEIS